MFCIPSGHPNETVEPDGPRRSMEQEPLTDQGVLRCEVAEGTRLGGATRSLALWRQDGSANMAQPAHDYAGSGVNFVKDIATCGVGRGSQERSGLPAIQRRHLQLRDESQSLSLTANPI